MFFASLQHKLIKSETLDPSGKGDAEVLFMTGFSTRPLTTPRTTGLKVASPTASQGAVGGAMASPGDETEMQVHGPKPQDRGLSIGAGVKVHSSAGFWSPRPLGVSFLFDFSSGAIPGLKF